MKAVLGWLKSHVAIVVLGLLAVAAPVAGFLVSQSMNTGLRDEYGDSAQKAYSGVSNATVSYEIPALPGVPGVSESLAPNTARTEFFQQERERRKAVLDRMVERGVGFNSGGDDPHGVLLPALLPDPPESAALLLYEMAELVTPAAIDEHTSYYDELFVELGFRGRAENERIAERLRADLEERLRRTGETSLAELEEKRREAVIEENVQRRIDLLVRHARDASLFAEVSVLNSVLPQQVFAEAPGIDQCFQWQFDAWVITDVLRSIRALNDQAVDSALGVPDAPVKRLLSFEMEPLPVACEGAASSSGFDAPSASSGGFGRGAPPVQAFRRGGGGGGGGRDFGGGRGGGFGGDSGGGFGGASAGSGSITGRTPGPGTTTDVRVARLSLVVDSARIPEVLAGLTSRNFVSVLDVDVGTVDVEADLLDGYAYGPSPVVRLDVELESVWLREWTKDFMPDCVKTALGIPLEGEAGAVGEAVPGGV